MSYTERHKIPIKYQGSVKVTYEASEHGGTFYQPYEGVVDAIVDVYVDTAPFDNSVANCTSSVRHLNGAVVAMNAAQVASIHKSADEVSSHVVNGFFNMIGSELSQNMAAMFAKFKAVFGLLTTKSAALEKQQIVMQDDYARISDRYNKIFQNLDEELEKRIVALDKNVFEISKRVQGEQLHSETSKKVTQFLLGVNEDEILQQQLLIANAKSRVCETMKKLSDNVLQETAYAKKMGSVVSEKACGRGEQNFIPVIFTESSNLNSDVMDCACFSNFLTNDSEERISTAVKNYFVSTPSGISKNNEEETKQIDEAFKAIAEKEFQDLKDEKSIRVYETLKKLKDN